MRAGKELSEAKRPSESQLPVAQRVCTAIYEVAVSMKFFSTAVRYAGLEFNVLTRSEINLDFHRAKKLSSAIKQQALEDDPCRVLQQLKGVGETKSSALQSNNKLGKMIRVEFCSSFKE